MSSAGDNPELKAGHPPAVKVGGMRVAQHHRTSEGDKEPAKPTEEDKEYQEEGMTKGEKHNQSVLVSGAVVKEDKAYPAAAVKHYHEKPMPTKEARSPPKMKIHNIHQPGKQ